MLSAGSIAGIQINHSIVLDVGSNPMEWFPKWVKEVSKMLNERKTCKTCMYFEIDKNYPERGICTLENCIVRIYCRCENHIE